MRKIFRFSLTYVSLPRNSPLPTSLTLLYLQEHSVRCRIVIETTEIDESTVKKKAILEILSRIILIPGKESSLQRQINIIVNILFLFFFLFRIIKKRGQERIVRVSFHLSRSNGIFFFLSLFRSQFNFLLTSSRTFLIKKIVHRMGYRKSVIDCNQRRLITFER